VKYFRCASGLMLVALAAGCGGGGSSSPSPPPPPAPSALSYPAPPTYTKNVAIAALTPTVSGNPTAYAVSPSLPRAWGNPLRLQQVLRCMITNAIKYRNPDAPLEIRIEAVRDTAGGWKVSVRDNGIGIAKQYHESVFAPFKRLHGKNIPGCGMGLAVCRRIVEAHGGRTWVDSTPDGGSDFQFTLREEPPSS